MTELFWIWCDIDGLGNKWSLAIERGDKLYFPVEDYEDSQETFASLPCVEIHEPAETPNT